jgi:purine/pyrimidine-nucleoside phosphorylase
MNVVFKNSFNPKTQQKLHFLMRNLDLGIRCLTKFSYFCNSLKYHYMFQVNKYFDGKVMSLSHLSAEGKATIGVLAKGEYQFGTTTIEIMTVISGEMKAKMPGESNWITYKKFESFEVPAKITFDIKVEMDTPYLCLYK